MEYKQFKYKNLCEMTKFTALTIQNDGFLGSNNALCFN